MPATHAGSTAGYASGVTTGAPSKVEAASASCLRSGNKHAWLEIVLDEGRNRQIRRLLDALDVRVLRLMRVAIGSLELGTLAKGRWRMLTEKEMESMWAQQSV